MLKIIHGYGKVYSRCEVFIMHINITRFCQEQCANIKCQHVNVFFNIELHFGGIPMKQRCFLPFALLGRFARAIFCPCDNFSKKRPVVYCFGGLLKIENCCNIIYVYIILWLLKCGTYLTVVLNCIQQIQIIQQILQGSSFVIFG